MSKKCTPLWREAHFQVKTCKTHQVRSTFGSWDVEKMHAVVAQSTFPSQNVQNTPVSESWEVEMSKKCMPLWRENISKSKVLKTDGLGPLLEVDTSFCVAGARDSACCHKWGKREGLSQFQLQPPVRSTTLHYTTTTTTATTATTLHYTTLRYTSCIMLLVTLHHTTLHYATLHSTTLHYTQLHYTTLRYATLTTTTITTTLHHTALHYTSLHRTTLHHTTPDYTTLTTTAATTLLLYTTLH